MKKTPIREEEINKQIMEEQKRAARPEEIRIIADWISSAEKTIPDVPDKDARTGFAMALEKIKTGFAGLSNANFGDEKIMKQIKNVYDQAHELVGNISMFFEDEKKK